MRAWLIAIAVLVLLCAGLVLRYFVYPATGSPGPTDAVVLLAGDSHARLPVALGLAESGPRVLVVSVADGVDNAPSRALCTDPGNLTVYCFRAGGADTRAEARAVGRLVAEHGWARIAVVTSAYHVARAGLLIGRCTDATVRMVAARSSMSAQRWGAAIIHETGGLLAAAVQWSC